LNLNNYNLINVYIQKFKLKVNKEVEKYKEEFKNDDVNISLKYNREDMGKILFSTRETTVNGATKVVLDQYYSKIKYHED
jgi:hypothetical protein